jgi:hypothetical protein
VKRDLSAYVLSFQTEAIHKRRRHYWTICLAQNPDELLSWGHAATRELAETAARQEVQNLASGLTQGGQVISTVKPLNHRIAGRH